MNRLDRFDRIVLENHPWMDGIPNERQPWRHFPRDDPFTNMREEEFRRRFRFSKTNVLALCDRLTPHLRLVDKAHALTPLQMTLLTLSNLGGDEFQRTTAY